MQRIQIKPDVVMNSSKLLPTSSVANIQDDLTRVRARLDHRIRSRHNIDGRLSKVIREIDDIERKMRKIKNFTQQSMERYTQVERDLANRSSRFNRLQSPNLMKRGNWWESYFSSDKKTRNRLINLLFPWLQLTFQRHFGLLYPIGPALSFNKWINPNSPREVSFSDGEKQAIVDYLKRVENGEVSSNMDQYAGMTNSYEGYIGENNIFGQPLGGSTPKNVETVSAILDFLPFIGNLKAASEAYLGYDPLTGRKLEDWERGVAAAAILGGGAAKLGGKVAPKFVDKVGDLGKGAGNKIDSDTIKKYIRDIEGRTGRELPKNQIEKLKEALRNKEYKKMTPIETAKHRAEFDKVKNKVIKEWEENTGQKWPVYNENVISEKTGKIIRKQGDKYDAHHIIENTFGGEHEWWNIHPAKFPNEHQAGIHGTGSPANTLFKGGKK
ncbi:pre-toxin TG domain-containing protein [Sutcliffiella cohnii]|uniref:pre-toxin TG domain-containing protein n=1 Tax=Sutcliffiella cohnii TaxID=33932 RepID=UPI002E219B1A